MRRAIKSLNVLAVMFLIAVTIGCDNNGGGGSSQDTQALTEHDFGNDPSLSADPEKHVIVKFLEHPDSEGHENDTGETGNDVIPMTYKRAVNHTYCWDDDDEDAEHFMILLDSNDVEILRLGANADCVTAFIEAGSYTMIIHHDGRIETTHPIFIIPVPNGNLGAKKEETIPEGILERAGRVLSNILEELDDRIIQTTNAQTLQDNINTLITTNSCPSCNLGFAKLRGADLSGADLTLAILFGADLAEANLTQADLTRANLDEANLSGANLTGANLTGALFFAEGSEPNLEGATWCDGNICQPVGIGICKRVGTLFLDNCDGTVTDFKRGLVWEKKVDGPAGLCFGDDKLHSVDATCNGLEANAQSPGNWLYKLNNTCNDDPFMDCSVGGDVDCLGIGDCCGFACHRDWRLPEVVLDGGAPELETILESQGNCGGGSGPCIDPIFGPTALDFYWSATTVISSPTAYWAVNFGTGEIAILPVIEGFNDKHVRAVRP